jgi:tripartite-type tricarboxylate transporter receptor subunit TctC
MKYHAFELTHVPYKGSAPGIQDLLAGQVAAMLSPVGDSLPYLSSGKLRIIGTSGAQRSKFAPDVPTFKEQGLQGMELTERFGVWAKAGVPEATLDRLHAAVQKVLVQPELVEFFVKAGLEADPISRQSFIKASRESYDAWGERVRITGFKPE